MHSPTGAANATVCVITGGAGTRRRSSGAAKPAITIPHAAARIALDRDTARGVYGRTGRALLARERGPGRRSRPAPGRSRRGFRGPPRDATARPARSAGPEARSPPGARRGRRCRSPPGPRRACSTPWWWWDLVMWASSRAALAASDPSISITSCSAPSKEPTTRRWSPWPTRSGRCWTSVPPRATLISCIPRQIPSTGMSASIAALVRAISKASRSGTVSWVSGWAGSP